MTSSGVDHLLEEDALCCEGLGEEPGLGDGDGGVLQSVDQQQGVVWDPPRHPEQTEIQVTTPHLYYVPDIYEILDIFSLYVKI